MYIPAGRNGFSVPVERTINHFRKFVRDRVFMLRDCPGFLPIYIGIHPGLLLFQPFRLFQYSTIQLLQHVLHKFHSYNIIVSCCLPVGSQMRTLNYYSSTHGTRKAIYISFCGAPPCSFHIQNFYKKSIAYEQSLKGSNNSSQG